MNLGASALPRFPRRSHSIIVDAALALFGRDGLAGVTLRSVAELGEVPTATVQRAFGNKENLLRDVFSAFIDTTPNRLCHLVPEAGGSTPVPLRSLPAFLAACIAEPQWYARRVMTVEFLLAAIRDPQFRPLARQWHGLAIADWEGVLGPGEKALATLLVELEVALTLDSIGMEADVALPLANAEIARTVLDPARHEDRYWFGILLRRAIAGEKDKPAGKDPSEITDFLDAGAQIVLERGCDAISFRQVAAKAARSFASVSSKFRRKDVLVSSICQHMVDVAMAQAPPPLEGPRDLRRICEITCDLLTGGNDLHGDYYFLGHVEMRLLAARNANFASMARRMRMLNGLYPLRRTDPTWDKFGESAFLVHAREIWSRGVALVQTAIQEDCDLRARLLERLMESAGRFERDLPAVSTQPQSS